MIFSPAFFYSTTIKSMRRFFCPRDFIVPEIEGTLFFKTDSGHPVSQQQSQGLS